MRLHRPVSVWFGVLAALAIVLAGVGEASAKRVALVVGNSAYRHVAELPNPRNDAEAVGAALASLGFEVISGVDLDRNAFEDKIREFSQAVRGAELALFFYAGHGLQVGGKNYLVPIDAELADESDLDFQTVSMDAVLRNMERERRTNLVILDACRNNPLAKNLARSMGTRSAGIGRGLAPLETGVGTLISYATQPGNVALDGDGSNSPFTTALLRHINAQNLDVDLMMRRVRRDVMDATGGKQVPWSNSSLTDAVFLKKSDDDKAGVAVEGPDLVAWKAIRNSDSPALFETYIREFPGSVYAEFAKSRLAELGGKLAALDRSSPGSEGVPVVHAAVPHADGQDCVKLSGGDLLCASSVLKSQGKNSYGVANLVDGETSTAWVEGKRGDGIGEWIVLDFGEPKPVTVLELRNGYTKSPDIFTKNSRVREIEIRTSAGVSRRLALDDSGVLQRMELPDLGEAAWVQLRILSVYPGSKYDDTALTELRVYN